MDRYSTEPIEDADNIGVKMKLNIEQEGMLMAFKTHQEHNKAEHSLSMQIF